MFTEVLRKVPRLFKGEAGWLKDLPHPVIAYAIGVLVRFIYVFVLHPPTQYISDEMAEHIRLAKNFAHPFAEPHMLDTLSGPGTGYLLGFLYVFDNSFMLATIVQFLISCAIPVVAYSVCKRLFTQQVAELTLVVVSFYFPLIAYAGYFLPDNPTALMVLVAVWALISSFRETELVYYSGFAFLSGITFGIASSMNTTVLWIALVISIYYLVLGFKQELTKLVTCILGVLVGLAVIILPLSSRCTSVNRGDFCIVSNELSYSSVVGHDSHRKVIFQNPQVKHPSAYISPVNHLVGVVKQVYIPHGAYEGSKNWQLVYASFASAPFSFISRSVLNTLTLYIGTFPWPSRDLFEKVLNAIFGTGFIFAIFGPAILFIFRQRIWERPLSNQSAAYVFLALPIAALTLFAFIGVGEPRIRIPFDTFMIMLACCAWVQEDKTPSRPLLIS